MGNKTEVLLLEDHADIRRMMAVLLARCGFEVVQAETVQEAIARLDGQSFAVLDLYLPDGSGAEVLQYMRKRNHPARVAIVTAAADTDIPANLLLPRDRVFRKPIDFDELIEWIHPQTTCG